MSKRYPESVTPADMTMLLKELKLADIRASVSERDFIDEEGHLRYLAQTITIFDVEVVYYWNGHDGNWQRQSYGDHVCKLGREREELLRLGEEMGFRLMEKDICKTTRQD